MLCCQERRVHHCDLGKRGEAEVAYHGETSPRGEGLGPPSGRFFFNPCAIPLPVVGAVVGAVDGGAARAGAKPKTIQQPTMPSPGQRSRSRSPRRGCGAPNIGLSQAALRPAPGPVVGKGSSADRWPKLVRWRSASGAVSRGTSSRSPLGRAVALGEADRAV